MATTTTTTEASPGTADGPTGVREHAQATILEHLEDVLAKEQGVRDAGDEGDGAPADDTSASDDLHDMRVASRRLRAAVNVFEPVFAPPVFRRVRSDLKALTRALGTAREWDVHAETLAKEIGKTRDEGERAALGYLARRVDERRAAEQAAMHEALDQIDLDGLGRRVRGLFEPAALAGADVSLGALAAAVLPERLDAAWSDMESTTQTRDPVCLHERRIAMKKLRYALEVLEPAFVGTPAEDARDEAHAEAKRIQEALGKHHDRVLLAQVVEDERSRLDGLRLWALGQALAPAVARLRESAEEQRRAFIEIVAGRTLAAVRSGLGPVVPA